MRTEKAAVPVWEAARWLARMAASDGVVTPSERLLLREFAEAFGLEPRKLFRMAHAIAGEVDIPEVELHSHAEMKGRMFEEFVVGLTADRSRFTRLNWSSDKFVDGIYSLDTLMPDLYLRHRLGFRTVRYYVECKYRSSLPDGILDISSQLGRYRRMTSVNSGSELFIVLGLGGTPGAPDELYLIPARRIPSDDIIRIADCRDCLCPDTPDAFHDYICRYFRHRFV